MNEVRLTGTVETRQGRWLVDGTPLVRCTLRILLPELDDPLAALQPSVLCPVMARGAAAMLLWDVWPGVELSVRGRLSFLTAELAILPEPSRVLVEAQQVTRYTHRESRPDQNLLVLSGTVGDPITAERLPSKRRSIFFLNRDPAEPCPKPGLWVDSILTWLDRSLARRTSGFELGQQVTLLGHLASTSDVMDGDREPRLCFLATHQLVHYPRPSDSDVSLQPPSGIGQTVLRTEDAA